MLCVRFSFFSIAETVRDRRDRWSSLGSNAGSTSWCSCPFESFSESGSMSVKLGRQLVLGISSADALSLKG